MAWTVLVRMDEQRPVSDKVGTVFCTLTNEGGDILFRDSVRIKLTAANMTKLVSAMKSKYSRTQTMESHAGGYAATIQGALNGA